MHARKSMKWINGAWLFLFVGILSGALVMFKQVPASANDMQAATQIVQKACMTFDNFMSDDNLGPL